MQDAWNQYGEDAFTFDILEMVLNINDLIRTEQRYLDERKPRYNPAKIALRNGADIKSDPQELQRRRERATGARLQEGMAYLEAADLRATLNRDNDITKVLSVARSLTPQERAFIEESSDLAEILYDEGIVSGKQFLELLDKMNVQR